MRTLIGFAVFATVALAVPVVGLAFAVHQGAGSALLNSFGHTLNDAKSLRATYTLRTLGYPPDEFSVALKKPNLARVETAKEVIVMDGVRVTTFSKAAGTYFRRPESEGDLKGLLNGGDLSFLLGFAVPDAYASTGARQLSARQVNGATLTPVEAKAPHSTTTYFLDPNDHLARTCTTEYTSPDGTKSTVVLNTSSLELNAGLPDSTFVFSPPAGSRELTESEMNADKWFTNVDEACKLAKATNRKVFIDFMATWCGPCKKLDEECLHTDTFKSFSKKFVFCRIDVDQQPAVGQQYGASAIPLQVIADSSGGVIDKTVGYGAPDDFFAFLRKNAM